MEALSNPWRVSSGTELDTETNQDSKSPMFFSHGSDQKPGYRQDPVRKFWPVLRYVFKNSARYTTAIMALDINKIRMIYMYMIDMIEVYITYEI